MARIYDSSSAYDTSGYDYDGTIITTVGAHGLHGQNFISGTEELIVVWNRRIFIPDSSETWKPQGLTLTSSNQVYFESFLDYVFMVNGNDSNYSYNGTTWSTTTNLSDSPIAQYIRKHTSRLYLYNIKIGSTTYKSRVWRSDLPKNNGITWGLETGSDLATTASSGVVTSAGSTFKTRNIKVGDPFLITSDADAGEYVVQSVDSETQITLSTTLSANDTGVSFWVGGNWFDVSYDDGDIGMGIGETSNELFFFKKNSVYRYNVTDNILRKVKMAPGTTSPRSIVSWGNYVYWFHPSGIYRSTGEEGENISDAITDVISSVSTSNLTTVAGWMDQDKDTINMFLGDVTTRDGDSISNCVAVYDIGSKTWTLKSYLMQILVATNWLKSNQPTVYAANNESSVYRLEYGNTYNGSSISSQAELKPVFPKGTDALLNFTRIRSYIDNGPDVQYYYKLLYKPTSEEDKWISDIDWHPLIGSQKGDRAEWYFPQKARASGVKLKLVESSTRESFLWEKIELYYSATANR